MNRSRLNCLTSVYQLLCIGLLLGSAGNVFAVVLYDVNFDNSPNVVGSLVPVGTGGAPRQTATTINFGHPKVAAPAGAMTSNFMAMGYDYPYSQVGLDLSQRFFYNGFATRYPAYRVDADIAILSPIATFKLFLDSDAGAHNIEFNSSNGINAVTLGTGGYTLPIGNYDLGKVNHVTVFADVIQDSWSVFLNNQSVFQGNYSSYGTLDGVRFSLLPVYNSQVQVGVDNIKIYGLPEPATITMLMVFLAAATRRRTRA